MQIAFYWDVFPAHRATHLICQVPIYDLETVPFDEGFAAVRTRTVAVVDEVSALFTKGFLFQTHSSSLPCTVTLGF